MKAKISYIIIMLMAFAICAVSLLYLSNKLDEAAQVESFVDHSRIPDDNLKP